MQNFDTYCTALFYIPVMLSWFWWERNVSSTVCKIVVIEVRQRTLPVEAAPESLQHVEAACIVLSYYFIGEIIYTK
jgi:hypothetical protein